MKLAELLTILIIAFLIIITVNSCISIQKQASFSEGYKLGFEAGRIK